MMRENSVVEFKNVCKIYDLKRKRDKKYSIDNKAQKKFYALKNVTFSINKGEIVGILGTNGSGKSTLASIIAGILMPTSGKATIRGEQSLIAINTGLNNQLTGLENIKVKGALLGLSKSKIEEITQGVIEFAELGDFLYQPVKSYSSGMKSRLGFAITISLDPDIIIIDEALSVGDSSFSAKCIKKMMEFKEKGKTIFFVSHSLSQVKSFCNKALWIEGGELKQYGDIEEVSENYSQYIKDIKEKTPEEKEKFNKEVFEKRIVADKNNKSIKKLNESTDIKNLTRVGRNSKRRRNFKRRKNFISIIIAIVLIIVIGIIGIIGIRLNNKYKSINNKNLTIEKQVSKEIESKEYNFLVLVEGEGISEYKNEYRTYLNGKDGKTVYAITNINIKSDGEISITNVPISLQIHYENLMLSDEIRFFDLIDRQNGLKSIEKDIINKKIDNIFLIKQENLRDFAMNLGIGLEISNNNLIWNYTDKEYYVNNSLIDDGNIDNFKKISNIIVNKLFNLDSDERSRVLSILFGNDINLLNDKLNIIEDTSINNVNVKFNDFTIEKVVLKEGISESDLSLLENNSLLEREILVLNKDKVKDNIYYKALVEKLKKAKEALELQEESSDADINVDNNDREDSTTTSNTSQNQNTTQNQGNTRPNENQSNTQNEHQVPSQPETPSYPEIPSQPEVPTEPETPNQPELPNEPEIPNESEESTEPEVPLESER